MTDFQSPSTVITKKRVGPVIIPGVSTAVVGIQGICEKGPVSAPVKISSDEDFKAVFGNRLAAYPQVYDAMAGFFQNSGKDMYINRTAGVGALAASRVCVSSTSGPASAGSITSDAGPFVLFPDGTIDGAVDGAHVATITIRATKATKTCTGGSYLAGASGDIIILTIAGIPGDQTIDFSSTGATRGDYIDTINSVLVGGKALASGLSDIVIVTDQKGSGAAGNVSSVLGDADTKLGISTGDFTNPGPNNVANILEVTASELVTLFLAAFGPPTAQTNAVANLDGSITWSNLLTGSTHSVQIEASSTLDTALGFDNSTHSGDDATSDDTVRFTASSVGAWGNQTKIKCVRETANLGITIAEPTASVRNYFDMQTAVRVQIGDQVSITGTSIRGVVTSIDGNRVTLEADKSFPALTLGMPVILETFGVYVYDNSGQLLVPSPYKGLRMSPSAGSRCYTVVINNTSRTPVTAEDLGSSATDPRPMDDSLPVAMTAGSDGATVTYTDFMGVQGSKTGVWAWDKIEDVIFISMPGVCDLFGEDNGAIALLEGQTYCENRTDIQMVFEGPRGKNHTGIKDWWDANSFTSMYMNMYWPYVQGIDPDLRVKVLQPPTGRILGAIARTHATRNFVKAPAGVVDGLLNGVYGLEYEIQDGSPEYDILFPVGINAIIKFTGYGYCIYGDATMDATKQYDSIGIVTGFNIAQREIKRRTRWVNFEPNNTETRARVVRDITGLLRGWRTQREPVLQGATDAAAFFIICDATNNTPAIIAQHKLVCRVGLLFQGSTRFSEYTLEQDTRAIDAELAATA